LRRRLFRAFPEPVRSVVARRDQRFRRIHRAPPLRAADAQAKADGVVLFLILHSWIHPGVDAAPTSGIITKTKRLQATMAACSTVAATFSGHRHANRVRLFRDYVCIDTARLIGYPLGFREITVTDDGWLTSR